MESENHQEIGFENEVDDSFNDVQIVEDFDSPEEIEFRRKLENPFHLFQKDDHWVVSEIFCLNCGMNTYPLIFDKLIIEKFEKSRTIYSKDERGNKIPMKSKPAFVYKYCEVLKCNHEQCGELFFRTYTIFEDKTSPEGEPRIIPVRKDKIPIKNESEDKSFEKAYNRYVEAVMAYNMDLSYGAGAAIRSVLEILCKIRGWFQKVLEIVINDEKKKREKQGVNSEIPLTEEEIEELERLVDLDRQMNRLISELQQKAPKTFGGKEIENIKLMMYWGHSLVHGKTDPSPEEIKSGLEILEEVFRILYFDIAENKRRDDERNRRSNDLSRNNQNFTRYDRKK